MIDWLEDLGDWLDGVLAVGTDNVRPEQLRTAQQLQTLVDQSGLTELSAVLSDTRQALQQGGDGAAEAIVRLLVVMALTRERMVLEHVRTAVSRQPQAER
jgi:hypothetical protein